MNLENANNNEKNTIFSDKINYLKPLPGKVALSLSMNSALSISGDGTSIGSFGGPAICSFGGPTIGSFEGPVGTSILII